MKLRNLIQIAALALPVSALLALPACGGDNGSDEGADETTGDGDGDATTGDGDGDPATGDGDGDPTTGDGDGDPTTGDGDGDGDGDPVEVAMVRVIHVGVFPVGENTGVDLFVDGEPSGISVEFKEGIDYVEFPAGYYTIDLVPAGGTIDDSLLGVFEFNLSPTSPSLFPTGHEIILAGYVGSPNAADEPFRFLALPEDAVGIPAGNTRLNVLHTAALAALSPLDAWVVDGDCAPVELLREGFEFGQVVSKDIPAGAIGVGLDVGQDATVDVCFQIPDLGADILVNVFAVNDNAGNVTLVAHLPDGSVTEVTPEP